MKKEAPFIHLFRTSEECYLYDVNKDKVVKISENLFQALSGENELEGAVKQEVDALISAGFLSSNKPLKHEHPITPHLEYYSGSKLTQLILQVTQSCNLRCSYCIYSGAYKQRVHSQKQMSLDIALMSVDYLFSHSKDSERVMISFYGGEPLLRMDLIKSVIDYVEREYYGKTVAFNMTTNGTLFTEDIIDYLVDKNFELMFSLDGPANIHNLHRRFTSDNMGSYDKLMEAVNQIRQKYPDYFSRKVSFNTVLNAENDFSCINEFVMGESIFKDNLWNASLVNHLYREQDEESGDTVFWEEREYEFFKLLLSRLGRFPVEKTSRLLRTQFDTMDMQFTRMQNAPQAELPEKTHHGGPCVPGAMRIFVTAEGNFYPCERVSEASNVAQIGNIYEGMDIDKARAILNIETASPELCSDCWVYRHCILCIASADGLDEISRKEISKNCGSSKQTFDYTLKTMSAMKELGYKN